MARSNALEIRGLDDMEKKLKFVTKNYPVESEKLLKKVGNKYKKHVQNLTPVRTGKLKKSYIVSKVKRQGKAMYVEFRSAKAPHIGLVERGHKIVVGGRLNRLNGGTHRTGRGKVVGKVEGKRMIKKTTVVFENEFPDDVEKMIDKFIINLLK